MGASEPSNETRCRAWLASMGDLTPWRGLLAGSALTLARLLDAEVDPAKAAAASRELRQIVGLLVPVAAMGGRGTAGERPESWSRPDDDGDLLAGLVDEVAAKRATRPA